MEKSACSLVVFGVFLCFLPSAALAQVDWDEDPPGELQGQLDRDDRRTLVDCDAHGPGVLQEAVDASASGDFILVRGTCNENLSIAEGKDRLTLDGGGTAIINAASTARDAIVVRGRGITLKGLTIRGGRDVITVSRGGTALIDGDTIERGVRLGIHLAQMGMAVIVNSTIQNNGGGGIVVPGGSFALIGFFSTFDTVASPNIIRDNVGNGIVLVRNSSARIIGNTISNNTLNGINVARGSQADIADNTINGNGTNGIQVLGGSGVNLGEDTGDTILSRPNRTTVPNGGFGIRCAVAGYTEGRLGTLNGVRGVQSHTEGCVNSLNP